MPNPASFCLFLFFRSHRKDKYSTNLTINDNDGVLGSRTWGDRMEDADFSGLLFISERRYFYLLEPSAENLFSHWETNPAKVAKVIKAFLVISYTTQLFRHSIYFLFK